MCCRPSVSIYDSTPSYKKGPAIGWLYAAGTSVAAPIIAAEFALAGGSQGVAYPAQTLYSHVGDSRALYDVVEGSNGECHDSLACNTSIGYDGPSGAGTPVGLSAYTITGSPNNTTPPRIIGNAEQGAVLTEFHDAWSTEVMSYFYQWARCNSSGGYCQPIIGATAPQYTVTAADLSHTIRIQETAANSFGEGPPASSVATSLVGRG